MSVRPLLSVTVLLAACGTAEPTCSIEQCAEACRQRGIATSADPSFVPAHVLSPEAAALLRPEIDDLRAGLVVEPAASGVCGGAAGECAGFFPTAATPVGPGTHRLVVTHRTPRLAREGDWRWLLDERCTVEILADGVAVPSVEPRITSGPVAPTQGRVERLVVADVVAPAERARACTWTVRFEGPEGRVVEAAGAYTVPAASDGRPADPASVPAVPPADPASVPAVPPAP